MTLRSLHALSIAALAVAVLAACPLVWAADDAPDLPVKRVVIFSSGVSFFEHNGDVTGNATVDLKFNVKDVNDLLKSMVLQDMGGGRISTVSYGSRDPITRTLQTFAIDLTNDPSLADLLRQVRGEGIELDVPNKIVGTIVGVETRIEAVGKDDTIEVDYVTVLTDDGLRSVALNTVAKIKLTNPKLDGELRQALSVLAQSHATDKKTVSLSFVGNGKRPVRVGYIQESPIWKTSYRLVLSDDAQPLLQGWAIVENTTEADWNNVGLTLISGRPISFIMDLYEPLYVNRPVVEPELHASLRPRTYDQDLAGADAEFRKLAEDPTAPAAKRAPNAALARGRGMQGGFGGGGGFGGLGGAPGDYVESEKANRKSDAAWKLGDTAQSVAQTGDVGEMFQYRIATPVTLQRGKSAMLPIVNESVKAEKLAIYTPSVHAKHPLSGLRFTNTTPLHLMQGPITVFDDNAYAGDARILDLPPGSERLVSYALDLDTEVAPSSKSHPDQLLTVKIVDGTLHATRKYRRTNTYVVKNSGSKEKTVLIEQPLDATWTLLEPKEPEKTRAEYRFLVKAAPGKPVTLEAVEERTASEAVAVTNLNDSQIGIYVSSPVVSDQVKAALKEVVRRKQAIQALLRARQELERQVAVIAQEQTRIRDNMAQLPKDSDLFRRYVTKFGEQEDQIEALRDKVTASLADEAKQQKELNDYLAGLKLE